MTEEVDEQSSASEKPKPKPTTQQEFNLAVMDAIRHVAEWCVKLKTLSGHGAVYAHQAAVAAGDMERAEQIKADAEEVRKAGLRYHNAALDMWEALQKDAGPELVRPRELNRIKVDD